MKKGERLSALLRSGKTVFSSKDIFLLWGGSKQKTTIGLIHYYVRRGELRSLRRGLYAKDAHYNHLELATKILIPSYVSFETILAREGVVFQYYEKIFVASYATRDIVCDGQTYSLRTLPNSILTNPAGIENKDECTLATTERAFLDTLFTHTDYHFDNLAPLNWEKVFEMLPLYDNERVAKHVRELHEYFLSQQ